MQDKPASQGTENKETGSFYTPEWCVDILLEMSGFSALSSDEKMTARIIDPACGDGAILVRIVSKSVREMLDLGYDAGKVKKWVENNVYGIELDPNEAEKCRENIARACADAGLDVKTSDLSNVITGDTFEVIKGASFPRRFDYVIGNPPYVRIHNLESKPDSEYISGMCDLYYAFYDIGQKLLGEGSKLCYIAPSSWMSSVAGRPMREHVERQGNINAILDFAHYQVFGNALTYTAIVVMDDIEHRNDEIDIWQLNEDDLTATKASRASQSDMWCNGCFYSDDVSDIKEILEFDPKAHDSEGHDSSIGEIRVRNGYATMCDKAYISDDGFDGCESVEIDVVKASKGKRQRAIYPHDADGSPMTLDDIERRSTAARERLEEWKGKLLKRNRIDEDHWWAYGRTQGIADTYVDKIAIQSLFKPGKALTITSAPAGVGVYGGIYVTGMTEEDLLDAVTDPAFEKYICALSKYKSGGYYAFSGKELERYLLWRRESQA